MITDTFTTLETAMTEWASIVEAMSTNEQHELINNLDVIIVRAARLRAYVDVRKGISALDTHTLAVDASNRLVAKVRKALGYAYPRYDITF